MIRLETVMAADTTEDITGLLAAWSDGDQEALRHLISVVYPETLLSG